MPARREARTSATETILEPETLRLGTARSAGGMVKRGKLYPEQGQIGGRGAASHYGAGDTEEVRCPVLGSAARATGQPVAGDG